MAGDAVAAADAMLSRVGRREGLAGEGELWSLEKSNRKGIGQM